MSKVLIKPLSKVDNFQKEFNSKLRQNPLLRDFYTSTDDFPKLSDSRNNLAREYLEAYRFYNLPPLKDREGSPANFRAYSADKNDKYQVDTLKNDEYSYPISYFSIPISPRAFYRESEALHNIDNSRISQQIIDFEKGLKKSRSDTRDKIFDSLVNNILSDNFDLVPSGQDLKNALTDMNFEDNDQKLSFVEMAVESILMPSVFDNNENYKGKTKFMRLWENAPKNSPVSNFRIAINRYLNDIYEQHRDDTLKPELRELIHKYFPFERFKLKPEMLARDKGLKHSLRLYLNNLKNFEPSMYEMTKSAVTNLNSQKPLKPDTEAYISIAAHQSEVNLLHFDELSKQDFDKDTTPIYIFVNGDDQKQIDERLSEINKFEDKLNLRISSVKFNSAYRNGLKKIPATIAAMDLAQNHDFNKYDGDVVGIFLDADIVKFPDKSHIKNGIAGIQSGKFRISKGFSFDEKELAKQNVNLSLLHLLNSTKNKLLPYINYLKSSFNKNDYKEAYESGLLNSGGHNFYSSILKNLTGGIKAHVNNEDPDWTKRASSFFMKNYIHSFYEPSHLYQAISHDLNKVIVDNGAIERTLVKNTPVIKIWDSHDMFSGAGEKPLTPVDLSNKDDIDLERIDEEILYLLKYLFNEVLDIDSKFLKYKSDDDKTIRAKPLDDSLINLTVQAFIILYQDSKDLSISDENKAIFQDYVKLKLKSFMPSISDENLQKILDTDLS